MIVGIAVGRLVLGDRKPILRWIARRIVTASRFARYEAALLAEEVEDAAVEAAYERARRGQSGRRRVAT